jgi:hypothetical protein
MRSAGLIAALEVANLFRGYAQQLSSELEMRSDPLA